MNKLLRLFLALSLATPASAHFFDPDPRGPLVQIALLLDTSNSMDGLIGQAKSQLWRIVNDLSGSRCRARAPRVEVALYEYGNSGLAAGENYIRQVLPFTGDLDTVSEKLFGLATNGGEEYCGAVIKDAARNLAWDARPSTYKAVFIAGNEPFTQGGVDFRGAVARAVDKGVVVNTIFCGTRQEGVQTAWEEGARRGRGAFLTINQDQVVSVPRTPYDDRIESLGRALNDTYVGYGERGRKSARLQMESDAVAQAAAPAGAAVERSLFKAKPQYNEEASLWDAVGAVMSGKAAAPAVKKDLPAEYQEAMDDEALTRTLKAKGEERGKLQKELDRLGKARAEHLSRQTTAPKDTLDKAVLEAVRAQARALDFVFDGN